MASAALKDELVCSICLNLYMEPVTLRCGHNFCQDCIETALDTQEDSGCYSCPECRKQFEDRPVLDKNRKLCNIVENFSSTQEEKSEIFCTYCVDSPTAATKTCVRCETSLCEKHLTAHNTIVDHVLVKPTSAFSGKKCPIHKKLIEYYCARDSVCLCACCCLVGKHKGHKVELLEEASEKRKEKLRSVCEKLTKKRVLIEEKIQNLQEHKKKTQEKADDERGRITDLLEDLRRQLEVQAQRTLNEISRHKEQVTLQVSSAIQKLEIYKDALSQKISRIEELCNITAPIVVLREPKIDDPEMKEPDVSDLDDFLISLMLHKSLNGLITTIKSKNEFHLSGVTDLSLDANTAHDLLALSCDLDIALVSKISQIRLPMSRRFTKYIQVMSTEKVSNGRHYWEVEIDETENWSIGVCYPTIERHGKKSSLGDNNKSWCLRMCDNLLVALHDSQKQLLNPQSALQRLGLYLDYENGRLSYYQLCDPIKHLHTFTATFTEPLHAAFFLGGGWLKITTLTM